MSTTPVTVNAKPGILSSAFILTASAQIVGWLLTSGVFEPAVCHGTWCAVALKGFGIASIVLSAFGYQYNNMKLKAAAMATQADLARSDATVKASNFRDTPLLALVCAFAALALSACGSSPLRVSYVSLEAARAGLTGYAEQSERAIRQPVEEACDCIKHEDGTWECGTRTRATDDCKAQIAKAEPRLDGLRTRVDKVQQALLVAYSMALASKADDKIDPARVIAAISEAIKLYQILVGQTEVNP